MQNSVPVRRPHDEWQAKYFYKTCEEKVQVQVSSNIRSAEIYTVINHPRYEPIKTEKHLPVLRPGLKFSLRMKNK